MTSYFSRREHAFKKKIYIYIIKMILKGASNGPSDIKYFLWGATKTHKHY